MMGNKNIGMMEPVAIVKMQYRTTLMEIFPELQ